MKTLSVLILSTLFTSLLWADHDLSAKKFLPADGGKTEIVRGEDWFSKALKISAGKDAPAMAAYRETFPFSGAYIYRVSADIQGRGTAFIVLEFLDAGGKSIASHKIAAGEGSARFRDLKGRFDGRMWRARTAPVAVRIILGVEKDSVITFDDVELEVDDD